MKLSCLSGFSETNGDPHNHWTIAFIVLMLLHVYVVDHHACCFFIQANRRYVEQKLKDKVYHRTIRSLTFRMLAFAKAR